MKRMILLPLALAAAPAAFAEPARGYFTATISFDRAATAEDAYADVLRQARRACHTAGRRSLDTIVADRACTEDLVDRVIARTSRPDIALLHMDRTGREIAAPRDMAALDR